MAKTQKESRAISLHTPSRADGSSNAMLLATLKKKFDNITIFEQDGETVKAVLVDSDGDPTNIGSLANFFYALVDGWLSGVGHGPDGSRMYVNEVLKSVQNGTSTNIRNYIIKAKPNGRSGVKGYTASIDDVLSIVTTHGKIIEASEEEWGLQKTTTRTSPKEEEEPAVVF